MFSFKFEDVTYKLEFASSSSRLLLIADASRAIRPSTETQHRNLEEFALYMHLQREHPSELPPGKPISFWIRGVHWDEEKIARLSRHLNFYMSLFDRETPEILIHENPGAELLGFHARRYPYGEFPKEIQARNLDDYLLGLWQAVSRTPNAFRGFLYAYQILEYTAVHYVKEEVLLSVRRLLGSPDLPGRIDQTARLVIEAIAEERADEQARMVAVLRRYVDPRVLWGEIEQNRTHFASPTLFDGGLTINPLIKESWDFSDFETTLLNLFPSAIRQIRNALVHAGEARLGRGIPPTNSNYRNLQPWRALLDLASAQLVAYGTI